MVQYFSEVIEIHLEKKVLVNETYSNGIGYGVGADLVTKLNSSMDIFAKYVFDKINQTSNFSEQQEQIFKILLGCNISF